MGRLLFKWRDDEQASKAQKPQSPYPNWQERYEKEDDKIFRRVGSTKRMGVTFLKFYEYPVTTAFRELYVFPDFPEHDFALRMKEGSILLEMWRPGALQPEPSTYTSNDRTVREILATIDQAIFDGSKK